MSYEIFHGLVAPGQQGRSMAGIGSGPINNFSYCPKTVFQEPAATNLASHEASHAQLCVASNKKLFNIVRSIL